MRKMLIPVLVLASLVGGCATADKSVFQGGTSVTATVQNPAGKRELASVELSYQLAAKAFVLCRDTRCVPRAQLLAAQRIDREKVYPALVAARRVVRDNPTVSGLSAVAIARQAVADYNAAIGR